MKNESKLFKETGTKRDRLALLRSLAAATALALGFTACDFKSGDDGDPALTGGGLHHRKGEGRGDAHGARLRGQWLFRRRFLPVEDGRDGRRLQRHRKRHNFHLHARCGGRLGQYIKVSVTKTGYTGSKESEAVGPVTTPITWTEVDLSSIGKPFYNGNNPYAIKAIAYGGATGQEKFVAVGEDGKMAYWVTQ
jgi:hypothetical protein